MLLCKAKETSPRQQLWFLLAARNSIDILRGGEGNLELVMIPLVVNVATGESTDTLLQVNNQPEGHIGGY